jgi:hypothetical protein
MHVLRGLITDRPMSQVSHGLNRTASWCVPCLPTAEGGSVIAAPADRRARWAKAAVAIL